MSTNLLIAATMPRIEISLVVECSHSIPCRIERGNYLVDVLQAGIAKPFWYYVIQRRGSDQIIDLVKFDNYEQALEAATEMLARMNQAVAAK